MSDKVITIDSSCLPTKGAPSSLKNVLALATASSKLKLNYEHQGNQILTYIVHPSLISFN
jgi:hypothetical protein